MNEVGNKLRIHLEQKAASKALIRTPLNLVHSFEYFINTGHKYLSRTKQG